MSKSKGSGKPPVKTSSRPQHRVRHLPDTERRRLAAEILARATLALHGLGVNDDEEEHEKPS